MDWFSFCSFPFISLSRRAAAKPRPAGSTKHDILSLKSAVNLTLQSRVFYEENMCPLAVSCCVVAEVIVVEMHFIRSISGFWALKLSFLCDLYFLYIYASVYSAFLWYKTCKLTQKRKKNPINSMLHQVIDICFVERTNTHVLQHQSKVLAVCRGDFLSHIKLSHITVTGWPVSLNRKCRAVSGPPCICWDILGGGQTDHSLSPSFCPFCYCVSVSETAV